MSCKHSLKLPVVAVLIFEKLLPCCVPDGVGLGSTDGEGFSLAFLLKSDEKKPTNRSKMKIGYKERGSEFDETSRCMFYVIA